MDFEVYDIAFIPIIMFLVSVAGEMGLPKRFSPVLALIIGLTGGIIYFSDGDIKKGILIGIVMASSAVGIYSGQKNVREEITYIRSNNKRKRK